MRQTIQELVERYQNSLYAVAFNVCKNQQDAEDAVFETVMGLPEKYRIVIHLFYYEDYSVREIGEILKISESNVKVRLSRGRMLLRETLKEEWDDDK